MIVSFGKKAPKIHKSCFIADGAAVTGDVTMGRDSSVWFNAVLRGDVNRIVIGEETNIQDCSVLHVGYDNPCVLGDRVTIGHSVSLHGCVIENDVCVGIGATVLNGAVVGSGSIIGAGALVTEGTRIPAGSLVLGQPGRVVRKVTEEDAKKNLIWADDYRRLKEIYRKELRDRP